MTNKKGGQKTTSDKTKSKPKVSRKTSSPIMKKSKEVAGEILSGAAVGAALGAINAVVEQVAGTTENKKTTAAKAKSEKNESGDSQSQGRLQDSTES